MHNHLKVYIYLLHRESFRIELKEIDTYYLPGKFSNIFGELKKSVDQILTQPTTFGVIVPLSGFNKKLGESYLLGLAESFQSSNIRFIIYDSRGLGANDLQIAKSIYGNNLIFNQFSFPKIFVLRL